MVRFTLHKKTFFLVTIYFIEAYNSCGRNIELDKPSVRIVPSRRRESESGPLGTFPWMASIGYMNLDSAWVHLCGGSLITKKFVLTAGHCIVSNEWVQETAIKLAGFFLEFFFSVYRSDLETGTYHQDWMITLFK